MRRSASVPSDRGGKQALPPHLCNSLSRRTERFEPHDPQEVTIYSCGPTVYARQHLGNMRPYVFVDTLRRALSTFGYPSKQVINITDVVHLTDDGDQGDDKLELAAQRRGTRAEEIAARFGSLFQRDVARLRAAAQSLERLKRNMALLQARPTGSESEPLQLWNEFQAALADDLDTPRAARDFAESDRPRAQMAALGFAVEDTARGSRLRRVGGPTNR